MLQFINNISGFFKRIREPVKKFDESANAKFSHDPSFVPYACHYDRNTLLCRNGELMQTVEIVGFVSTHGLRTSLRKFIKENLAQANISIWLHSVRTEEGFTFDDLKTGDFSEELHEAMLKSKKYKIDFVNKLYITIIIAELQDKFLSMKHFHLPVMKKKQSRILDKNTEILTSKVAQLMETLASFVPKQLTTLHNGESEIVDFLHFLTHFTQRKKGCLPLVDLAKHLIGSTFYNFGFNSFSVERTGDEARFCNILTIKDSCDISSEVLSDFMQIEGEFVVTEVINFASSKKAMEALKYQKFLFEISGDSELAEHLKLDDDNFGTLCNHAVTITPIASNLYDLAERTEKIVKNLAGRGLQIVRDDLTMEQKTWFNLPANRSFCWKMSIKNVGDTCNFAGLQYFPTGSVSHSFALFWSSFGLPYLFGFITEGSIHKNTLILGKSAEGRTILQNFLISESRCETRKILLFDFNQKSRIFVKSIRGDYKILTDEQENFTFNPCNSNDIQWQTVLRNLGGPELSETLDMEFVRDKLGAIGQILAPENCWNSDQVVGIDLTEMQHSLSEVKDRLGTMIMESLINDFDQMQGALILIEEPWLLFQDFFSNMENLQRVFEKAAENDIKIILTGENYNSPAAFPVFQTTSSFINSLILFPGFHINTEVAKMLNLNKEDLVLIRFLHGYERHFFVKQGNNNAVLNLDFVGMKEVYVLSSAAKHVDHMISAMRETNSEDPKTWLPKFYELCMSKT